MKEEFRQKIKEEEGQKSIYEYESKEEKMKDTYPIAVFEDRYGGVYSGGEWIAVAGCDIIEKNSETTRFEEVMNESHASDEDAWAWEIKGEPEWVAVGNTPDEAINNLKKKFKEK